MTANIPLQQRYKAQAKPWVFFVLSLIWGLSFNSHAFAEKPSKRPIVEELSKEEKETMIKQLLEEGDRFAQQKEYNLANASYESVFVIIPDHVEASKRIDQLKKVMMKEGVSETQLVTRIYDEEIEMRVKHYMTDAKEFMKRGKYAQARFNLQKLLLISPLDEEASKLYKEVNQRLDQAA